MSEDKLDYKEHFEKTAEDIRAREARKQKVTSPKESGRSVFEIQKELEKKAEHQE